MYLRKVELCLLIDTRPKSDPQVFCRFFSASINVTMMLEKSDLSLIALNMNHTAYSVSRKKKLSAD